jgi:hypothetical protein
LTGQNIGAVSPAPMWIVLVVFVTIAVCELVESRDDRPRP